MEVEDGLKGSGRIPEPLRCQILFSSIVQLRTADWFPLPSQNIMPSYRQPAALVRKIDRQTNG